ncbi:hypothetical protein LAD77_01945 [Klebsiella pneumoniae]|nr:hypothetical protein [Klebsiella pneumoniae]
MGMAIPVQGQIKKKFLPLRWRTKSACQAIGHKKSDSDTLFFSLNAQD